MSVKEYFQQEINTNTKYEYHNGKIFALAGGSLNHSRIGGNVYVEISNRLRLKQSKCLPYNSDARLFIEKKNTYVYPDLMVICEDDVERDKADNYVKNPILIVEVLSKSTEAYDRGDKFWLYRQIPSFREYVLIEQSKYLVDVHFKHENSDLWSIKRYEGLEQKINLESIDVEITMSDLYTHTVF